MIRQVGIYETNVFGATAYHAKCQQCGWTSGRYGVEQNAVRLAQGHVCGVETPDGLLTAVKQLGVFTGETYRLGDLTGPRNAKRRASLMTLLLGRKAEKSECGINRITDEFLKRSGIGEGCPAKRSEDFIAYCRRSKGGQS